MSLVSPENTVATVVVPCGCFAEHANITINGTKVIENGKFKAAPDNVKYNGVDGSKHVFEVTSGEWKFTASAK